VQFIASAPRAQNPSIIIVKTLYSLKWFIRMTVATSQYQNSKNQKCDITSQHIMLSVL